MARGIHRLTALQVAKAARKGLTLCDGGGLYLQNGSSWIFRYTKNHKTHWLGLGPLALVDLNAARTAALANRRLLFEGIDPLAQRKAQRAATANSKSFDDCCADYIAAHGDTWRNPAHRQQWTNTFARYVAPVLGALPVAAVDTGAVMRVLEPIWRLKPETAVRLRGRIEAVLSWATVCKYRSGENPARWRGHLDQLLPAKDKVRATKHHAALPYAELPGFMADLRQQNGNAVRALEFTILTAVRSGDIFGQGRADAQPMLWAHVDPVRRLWIVPRTKSGATHRVPLSAAALAVLEAMRPLRDASNIVFPGIKRGEPLTKGAMLAVLQRMGRGDLTTHGFRATFKTWASEVTSFQRDTVEAALTHTIGDKLEKAYRRGDLLEKRVRLMDDWADFCDGRSGSATVVPLRA